MEAMVPKNGSDLGGKIAIVGVSFLGTLGLALSVLYLVAVALNFFPGFSKLSEFMIGTKDELSYGFLVLILPYTLTMAHLYLRAQLGHWLYMNQYYDLAYSFCSKRKTHNLFRSKAESLANRSILLALLIRDASWQEAITFYEGQDPRKKNPFFWRWQGWGAELFHRLDDGGKLSKVFENGTKTGKYSGRYLAILAQYYFEKGDSEQGRTVLEKANWNGPNPRALIFDPQMTADEKTWENYLLEIPTASIEAALAKGDVVKTFTGDPRSLRLLSQRAGEEEE